MALTPEDTEKLLAFVKREPRTMQDIAHLLGRSWLTADSYVQQVKERTGLVSVKVFRKGSPGALKLVYYNHADSLAGEDLRTELFRQIRAGRRKTDFDFFEVYQHVLDEKKSSALQAPLIPLLRQASRSVLCFSGNLSFLTAREGKQRVLSAVDELVERGVRVKVLCRVNAATMSNLSLLRPLMGKGLIEVRHCYQPLRGFVIDDSLASFRTEESAGMYRAGELAADASVVYEVRDAEWVAWLQKVFWQLYRTAPDHETRVRQLERL
ncbi:phosphatidylserine/phosphatidylglycerophosphate/cardiolipin synthase family protein [Candidatus Woesearchaeota archaeon]|nr:phosphatidylserine/phosphatidylglycerophosphate/cardiolipin synthase family protein [Candidatus Woesearchaeota archaeon]